ncbi:MAG: type II secretion system protein GspE [Acidobacteria bacterium]|nr:MAG: type II secretion system protein GspE [Acidobacteriota bacterium]
MRRKRLGEVLHERGKISAKDLEKALEEQQEKLSHLGELLLERGLVGKSDLIAALEEVSLVPYVDIAKTPVDPATLALIPREVAERLCVLPIRRDLSRLVVVMSDPRNTSLRKELGSITGMAISPRLAFRAELREAIAHHYSQLSTEVAAETVSVISADSAEEMEFVSTSTRQANKEAIAEAQAELRSQKTPAVRLVSEIIRAAMEKRASDIHIDPRLKDTVVRIRIDGVLRDFQHVPRAIQHSLVSRIKILADMDIAEHRNPQDGRFMISTKNRSLDLRVSTLPTQYGEKVVIRLLEPSAPLLNFTEIGFAPSIVEGLQRLLSLPQGLILVTGPTGSGKSTTLYSALNFLRKPSVNIVTVEDPVEYALPGINQVHVNTKAGLTFASVLRSMLRQDPNVIMVGEIRDQETAEIALKVAQTGQLVLSTLHTNDSVSAIVRLLDLGVPPFLIASSVIGVLAQRLVRKLCACHSVEPMTADLSTRLAEAGLPAARQDIRIPGACGVCDRTGFKGRTAVAELLIINEAIRAMIRAGESTDAIRELARLRGMRLMHEDGLDKVKMGLTTYDEILRIVPFEAVARALCAACGQQLHAEFQFCPFCGERRSTTRSETPKLEREGALLP